MRPGPLLRWLLRLPVLLYRRRLGWLLGHRFLLTHVGRRSDWYQNLRARPPLQVVGGRTFTPARRELPEQEAVALLAGYERRDRLLTPVVRAVLSRLVGWPYDGSKAARRRLVAERPLVALWPAAGRPVGTGP